MLIDVIRRVSVYTDKKKRENKRTAPTGTFINSFSVAVSYTGLV